MNFGQSYRALIKTVRTETYFAGAWRRSGPGLAAAAAVQRNVRRLKRGEELSVDDPPAVSSHPAQDPLIPDADGELLAIEVFKQGNRIFARYPKEIFEFDRRDFTMIT
jgi:hypothetical protein